HRHRAGHREKGSGAHGGQRRGRVGVRLRQPVLDRAAPGGGRGLSISVTGTVLLVEDDENDRLLIERAFDKGRIANPIRSVTNGEDAVAYLSGTGTFADRERHPMPVVMLLDLKLPRKSGLEVLEWVRQQSGLKRLPVVVLTSSREAVDINRAYDLGANSSLVKPVGFESLFELAKSLNLYWLMLNEDPALIPPSP